MEELFPRLPEEDVKSSLEKYERVVLAGKGYFSAERRAVRRLQSALNQKKSQWYRRRLVDAVLNGTDKEAASIVKIIPHLPVKSNDGKRTYWLNFKETEAVVIIPELGTPDPDKKFHVKKVPADETERRKTFKDAKVIGEYFHHDIAGDFVISDYVPEKDWTKSDDRVAPKDLTVAERLTSLCEKLRNVAERKPPIDSEGRSYFWTRRQLYQMDNSRENINLLVPVIQHYLGVSDPLWNPNADAVFRLAGVLGVKQELQRIIGHFLARMLGEKNNRPDIKEVVEFFECVKRYQENNSQEEMEVLKLMGNSRDFQGDYGLPQFPKARWLWFVELSDPKKHEFERLNWVRLAQAIADEKEKYTSEQRQFLRIKLQEYREEQFDKDDENGKYQKIITAAGSIHDEDLRDLFPVGEEKEALIGLMEEIKKANACAKIEALQLKELIALARIAQENPAINFNNLLVRKMLMRLENPPANILAILSTPVNNRTPEQHDEFHAFLRDNENIDSLRKAAIYEELQKNALTNEIALEVFCGNDSSQEQRKYMAERIAENILEYSGDEMVQFFNKLKEYNLLQSVDTSAARDKVVAALKVSRSALFYFNPKRLGISSLIKRLEDPDRFNNEENLLDRVGAPRVLDNILRLIPLNVLNAFTQSTKPFKIYKQYELVRTPNGKVFAIDHEQCVGSGAFGSVFVAYEVNKDNGKLGKRVAVKLFNQKGSRAEILNEARALEKSFDVKGIVSDKDKTCLVMEYVEGKPIANASWKNGTFALAEEISTLSLAERFKAIVMLIAEVSTAHQHRNRGNAFLHFDIRLENVHLQINNNTVEDVRLLDFGFATFISAFRSPKSKRAAFIAPAVGTRGFIAPEQIKNLKSDMRSLLPTILPLLGVRRLYYSQDVDKQDTVKYYLRSGLLKGMENELPLPLRAALFQFLIKMELYEDASSRPSDEEAFNFFNALYNYCRTEDKTAWEDVEYHKLLQQAYSGIIPENTYRWFCHLREIENPDGETKTEIQRAAEMAYGAVLTASQKLALAQYFIENTDPENQNKARWKDLLQQLVGEWPDLDIRGLVELVKVLSKERGEMPEVVFKSEVDEVSLDDFVMLLFRKFSERKNYERDQASWKILADIIVENLDKYSGKDLLTILRKINKFNGENEYDVHRDAVKAKLHAQWSDACAQVMAELHISERGLSWNRSCVNDLKAAIDGQCFWSRNNHKYLKNAVSESPNQAVDAIVKKLGKVVPAG